MKRKISIDTQKIAKRILGDEVSALASQLSYSFLVSFFPFTIFIMTLLGFSSIDAESVLFEIKGILPTSVYDLVHDTILEILSTKDSNLLSFSIIFTIWSASSGLRGVIKGINKAYGKKENRSFIKIIFVSIIITIILGVLIILTILLLVFGQIIGYMIMEKLNLTYMFYWVWNITRYIVILSSSVLMFSVAYRFIPSKKLKWKDVIPGALFATVGWIVCSFIFAFYVNNFANYSRVYGSIGAVIILLVWLYLISIVIILGGEINASIVFDKGITLKARK